MKKVLVVDDSQALRAMITNLLKDNGIPVMEAANGVEAQNLIAANFANLSLVITDLIMPEMNGYELCRWIKNNTEHPDLKNLLVIMCTSKNEDFDKYWGMKQGADAYITKPFHPDDMMNLVNEMLQKSS